MILPRTILLTRRQFHWRVRSVPGSVISTVQVASRLLRHFHATSTDSLNQSVFLRPHTIGRIVASISTNQNPLEGIHIVVSCLLPAISHTQSSLRATFVCFVEQGTAQKHSKSPVRLSHSTPALSSRAQRRHKLSMAPQLRNYHLSATAKLRHLVQLQVFQQLSVYRMHYIQCQVYTDRSLHIVQ